MKHFQVILTPRAERELNNYIDYLISVWPEFVSRAFIAKYRSALAKLEQQPLAFQLTKRKDVRKLLLDKHIILYYRVRPRKQVVEILSVFHTSRKPL